MQPSSSGTANSSRGARPIDRQQHSPAFIRPRKQQQRIFWVRATFDQHAVQGIHPKQRRWRFHTLPEPPAACSAPGSGPSNVPGGLPAARYFAPLARPLKERSACSSTSSWAARRARSPSKRVRSSWACLRRRFQVGDALAVRLQRFFGGFLRCLGLSDSAAAGSPAAPEAAGAVGTRLPASAPATAGFSAAIRPGWTARSGGLSAAPDRSHSGPAAGGYRAVPARCGRARPGAFPGFLRAVST